MGYRDLHAFLDRLEAENDLQRIAIEVDPLLEVAEITDRVCKREGKALLFQSVAGSPFPAATNLFGSERRVARALGVDDCRIPGEKLARLLEGLPHGRVGEKMAALPRIPAFARCAPEVVFSAPCQEVVEESPDLTRYPFLKGWPHDGSPGRDGRFITLPLVFTRDPETGTANCGIYRIALFGGQQAGIHWYRGRGGERHYRACQARRERMPVAVALGGAPACLLSAMLPLPETLDEMHLAGFLLGKPVELVRCRTNDLLVPARAELVIEGYLEPGETAMDGAFGNHTGFYGAPAEIPVLRVTCITRRHDCICPSTVVGRPPMEDCHLARAAWQFLLPLLQTEVPEVVDIYFPPEWIFHASGIVSVRTAAPGAGREIIGRLWENEWLRSARLLAVVDADQDVRDLSGVAWRLINYADWQRDLQVSTFPGSQGGSDGFPWGGSRLAIDATRKKVTASDHPWPEEVRGDAAVKRLVDARWKEYGL